MVNTCTRVSLRQRAIKNDRISLYLDFYPPVRNPETMQMSRREYLGIYIYAHPKNEMEREFNTDMLNKAEGAFKRWLSKTPISLFSTLCETIGHEMAVVY